MSDVLPRLTTTTHPDQIRALSDAASTPSLVALSYALRHPETWPSDFAWDFRACDTCAMGLTARLWRDATYVGRAFNIGIGTVHSLFSMDAYGIPPKDVTPTHVADAIDAFLAATVTP